MQRIPIAGFADNPDSRWRVPIQHASLAPPQQPEAMNEKGRVGVPARPTNTAAQPLETPDRIASSFLLKPTKLWTSLKESVKRFASTTTRLSTASACTARKHEQNVVRRRKAMENRGNGDDLRSASSLFLLALLLCFTSGCGKKLTLWTPVERDQTIEAGALVLLMDSPQPVGFVRSLREQTDGRVLAELTISNRLGDLRAGTVHIRQRGRIALDASRVGPAAERLRNGDVLPLESKSARTARQLGEWSRLVGLLLVLGLILLGICVAKLLFFKAAGPLIPLFLALALAGFTGWVVGPLLAPTLTPTLDKWYSRTADGSGAEAQASASVLGRLQSAVTRSLATKPDPMLVSWFVVSAATLPVWILFVSWVRSVSRRGACTVLVPAVICFSAATVAAAPDGISYTRDWLRAEQQATREFFVEVDRRCATARRLLDAGLLRDVEEEIVKGNFFLDAAESRLDGHASRIGRLKGSPLAYIKSEEQKRLLLVYESLVEQDTQLQQRVSELHERNNAKGGESRLLQSYLSRREHYQQRIARGLTDADSVLVELRQLRGSERKQQADESGRQIAELRSTAAALRDEVQRLREHVAMNKPLVVTNLVERERIVEKPMPTPLTLALEQPARDSAPDVQVKAETAQPHSANVATPQRAEVAVTSKQEAEAAAGQKPADATAEGQNSAAVVPAPPVAGSAAGSAAPVSVPGNAPSPVAEASSSSTPVSPAELAVRESESSQPPAVGSAAKPATQLLAVGSITGLALVALVLVTLARWWQRRFEVVIGKLFGDGSVEPTTLEVQARTERIVLGGIPRVEPADLPADFPAAIIVNLFGRAKITPGTARVIIGERAVENASAPLRVGESFQIEFEPGSGTPGSVTYVLRDIGRSADADSSLEIHETAESRS